jgi:two-component system, LuxR family, response regulator FixJ
LLERINKALETDRAAVRRESEGTVVREKVDTLTGREKQVLVLLTQGQSNKLIARKLDLSPRTVEGYRARITEKLNAKSVADLVRIVQQCETSLEAQVLQVAPQQPAADAADLPKPPAA